MLKDGRQDVDNTRLAWKAFIGAETIGDYPGAAFAGTLLAVVFSSLGIAAVIGGEHN